MLNFIGLGLGPMFTGALSDVFKKVLISQGVDGTVAVADGLRWAIRATVVFNLWSALHYYLASRTLREDIAEGDRARLQRDQETARSPA